jgi:hypothetical protein
MSYPFRQGIDYGVRQGTLGLCFHMSEGGDGLVSYLARHDGETVTQWRERIRGVSANACILSDGTVWQMVDWSHAAGSMNPADRNPDTTGYYNGTVIKDVLGSHYVDPNTWSIAVEIAGFRATGPTAKQVDAAIAWAIDMKSRFPTLRGAFGHHDQTDTKGCPGGTANMKAIFAGVGGHGLWPTLHDTAIGDEMAYRFLEPAVGTVTVTGAGHSLIRLSDGARFAVAAGEVRDSFAKVSLLAPLDTGAGDRSTCYLIGAIPGSPNVEAAILLATDVTFSAGAPTDCAAAVTAEHDRVKAAAIASAEAL